LTSNLVLHFFVTAWVGLGHVSVYVQLSRSPKKMLSNIQTTSIP